MPEAGVVWPGRESVERRSVAQRRKTFGATAVRIRVLPGTVLKFERLLEARALDLRAASALLREDPGALLQMFRLLAEECPEAESRPERLEECLASVPMERLLRRLRGASAGAGAAAREMEAFARHAAEIGRGAESVAESLGLVQEQAWLVGMLHELGVAPGLPERWLAEADRARCCARLARRYRLPARVREALDEVHREVAGSVWRAVVAAAHELQPAA